VFSGFEVLDEDPFWVPQTEEELEDFGEKGSFGSFSDYFLMGMGMSC